LELNDSSKINVVLVDDQLIFIESLQMALELNPHFNILLTTTSGNEALNFLVNNDVDVLVMDIVMPEMSGLQLFEQYQQKNINTKVIGLSGLSDLNAFSSLWSENIDGLIHKSDSIDVLSKAIVSVHNNIRYISETLNNQLLNHKEAAKYSDLSTVDRKLLFLLVEGQSLQQITEYLSIDEVTLISHKKQLFTKVGAENINDLIRFSLSSGLLIDPEYIATTQSLSKPSYKLTKREHEVLTLLSKGLTQIEVAELLSLSHYTVGDYVKALYKKLNVSSRAEMTREAIKLSLC
jgi:DNA-binding NarL/FixJ family response regulator